MYPLPSCIPHLQVKAASRSELRFVQGQPWLLHVGRQRLTGAAPAAPQPGCSLAAAGRRLVLEAPAGGSAAAEEAGGEQAAGRRSLHTLDVAAGVWAPAAPDNSGSGGGAEAPSVAGRAVCSVGGKLLGFGGALPGGALLPAGSTTAQLVPDLPQWVPAPAPADAAAALPAPRQGAALAYCPRANAVFMYGGRAQDGRCLDDLWRYDVAQARWARLDTAATARQLPAADRARTPCIPERPPACEGAALAVSEAGDRLWLMGGALEDGRCSSELHW